jgi:hypothetical protein
MDDASYDPLEALRERLAHGRDLADASPDSASLAPVEGDPLERLEQRVRDASDPAQWAELLNERTQSASQPLSGLFQAIESARLDAGSLPKAATDELAPYVPPTGADGDPLEALRSAIDSERDALGGRREPLAYRSTASSDRAASDRDAQSASSGVATELLDALAASPLSGEVRARVARRLAHLADDRDSDELRELLRWIVQDDVPDT